MTRISDMAVFSRVVELSNLSAAGRDLRLSAAVVSSRIARLEDRLGARLLTRTTRRVSVTPEGEIYYQLCLRVLDEVEKAESAIVGHKDLTRGPLKVAAPSAFGRRFLAPLVPGFLADHPDIQFQFVISDRFTDLIGEKVDLAIRMAELKDASAIVRTLAPERRVLCAAPEYLDAHGTPSAPDNLSEHNCLLLRFPGSQQYRWTLQTPEGLVTYTVAGNMDSDNSDVLRDWCLNGQGIALKSLWEVSADIDAGRLRIVLPEYPPESHAVYAVFPHGRYLPRRVRVFIDYLVDVFNRTPDWETSTPAP